MLNGGDVWHIYDQHGDVLTINGVALYKKALARFIRGANMQGFELCWNWTRTKPDGYGQFNLMDRRTSDHKSISFVAHRVSWVMANQMDVPSGLLILHSCDNRACVNPLHLRPGTHKENTQDAIIRCRFNGSVGAGERNVNAKLTEDMVRSIRSRHGKDGATYAKLAEEYGLTITKKTIRNAKQGKTWSHVDD